MSAKRDRYTLFYDGSCGLCRKVAHLLLHLRPRAAIHLVDAADPRAVAQYPQISPQQAMQSVHLLTPDGTILRGYDAVVGLTGLLPLVRYLVPLMQTRIVRRIGWWFYEWVTAHRHQISHALFLE